MADLIQSVTHTVDPQGKVTVYQSGMLVKRRSSHRINVWWRWLSILKAKYHWTDEK